MNKMRYRLNINNALAGVLAFAGASLSLQAEERSERTPANPEIEVAVVATRSPEPALLTPGTTGVIGGEALARAGTASLQEALRYEPGVSVPFDFGAQDGLIPYLAGGSQGVNIRGLEGNRVALEIDGIRQPEDFVAQAFLGAGGPGRVYFDPAVLHQIEIFKSASSSLYGSDALGGTVALRTVTPASLLGGGLEGIRFENQVSHITLNKSLHNRLTAAAGDGRMAASVVYSYRQGEERENNGDNPPNPADFTSHAAVATVSTRLGDWAFDLTGDLFRFEQFTRGLSAEGVFFGGALTNSLVTLDEKRTRERVSLSASSALPGVEAVEFFTVRAYWQDASAGSLGVQQGQLRFGPFPTPRDRRNELDFRTRIQGLDFASESFFEGPLGEHHLRFGAEISESRVEARFLRTDFRPDSTFTQEDRIGMAPSKVDRMAAFVFDEIIFGADDAWSLFPGLRIDRYRVRPENTEAFLARTRIAATGESVRAVDYSNTAFAPSLSLLHRFAPEWNAYASYGRGIRNPSAEELNGVFTHGTDFIVVPNPELREERADSFEIGLQHAGTTHRLRTAVFHNRFRDFLQSNTLVEEGTGGEPDTLTTVNLARVRTEGVEIAWDYRAPAPFAGLDGWETGLSFALTRGKQRTTGQPLNTIDPARAVAYVGLRPSDAPWDLRLTGTFIDRKRTSRIDQTTNAGAFDPVASVFLLDLNGGFRFNENWSVRLGLNNLTNRSYYLWSTARRGGGHGGGAADRNTQPGINATFTLSASF